LPRRFDDGQAKGVFKKSGEGPNQGRVVPVLLRAREVHAQSPLERIDGRRGRRRVGRGQ
jgi:hypothetical protein